MLPVLTLFALFSLGWLLRLGLSIFFLLWLNNEESRRRLSRMVDKLWCNATARLRVNSQLKENIEQLNLEIQEREKLKKRTWTTRKKKSEMKRRELTQIDWTTILAFTLIPRCLSWRTFITVMKIMNFQGCNRATELLTGKASNIGLTDFWCMTKILR